MRMTEHLKMVFSEEGKLTNFQKLCKNLNRGSDIYEFDAEGRERHVSRAEANKAVQKVFMEICGLEEKDLKSAKTRRRAEQDHAREIFEIIEEEIDFKINEGFENNEWFNEFVEKKNLALGDANEFVVNHDFLFVVGDYSGDNHDITMQQYGEGEVVPVKTEPKTVKIGKDIDLIILGRIDFAKWIDRVAASYVQYVQSMVYAELKGAATQLPSDMKDTGALSPATKARFDALIEKVANVNGTDVVVMGTKTALKHITAIADVNWASDSQKESIANTGRLGSYEGTTLIEIPQRLIPGTRTVAVENDVLYIIPIVEDKFVKFVDEGETEIFEVTEKAKLVDDFDTYEMSRRMGADVVLGSYFGYWKF